MNTEIKLSVVIPVYNEEGNISLLHDRLNATIDRLQVSKEYIFINDGSKDQSIQIIKKLAEKHNYVKYINFSRNFGHQIAVSAGIDFAKGERIVIIDSDLQDPPELIFDMYTKMDCGFEVVYAKRKSREGESITKKTTAKLFYRILSKITEINIPVDTGDYRIIDRKIVEILKNMPEQEKYLRGQIAWAGFRQTFIEYDRQERHSGNTGYPFSKMLRFALNGITSFSDFPLKFATYSGFISALVAFLLMIYALYSRFIIKDYVPGWASLMICILFLGGVQLISLGIIGEYLGRLSANVKKRPLYIIDETNTSKEPTKEV